MPKRPPEAQVGRISKVVRAGRAFAAAADSRTIAWVAAALACVTASNVVMGLGPLALKRAVDLLAIGPSGGAGPVMAALATYVAAVLGQRLFEQVQAYAYGRGEQRLTRRFYGQVFAHTLALPLAYHLESRSGALSQTLSQAVAGGRLILVHLALTLVPVLVQAGVVGAVMYTVFGPQAGAVFVFALGAYGAVFTWGVLRLATSAKGISAAQIRVGGATADSLMNIETLKAFAAERRFATRQDRALGEVEAQWRAFLARRLENGVAVTAVFGLTLGGSLVYAGLAVAEGRLTLGGFVLINTYLLQLLRPLELLGFALRDIGQGFAYLDAALEILARKVEGDPGGEAAGPPGAGPADLVFDGVDFEHGGGRAALRDISFHARPGEMVAIVGPSGAGKSSLLRLVLRLFAPAAGQIRLDGGDIVRMDLTDLRGQIALVSQDTILFNDTLGENIAFAREAADTAAIFEAAAAAQLTDFFARLPEGLDTPVGERGLKLSGGEKQRVSIARAALKKARLILFDEATAALDPATERAVWAAVSRLAQGATSLVVTHRLATVTAADQILVMDAGRIVERGRHGDLLDRGGPYARLWGAQSGEASDPG